MIHRLWSSLGSFKALTFRQGLNVVLADRTAGSTDQQTRNRAGKSSLVEIIHYLAGSNVEARSIFRKEALDRVNFSMAVDLDQRPIEVTRSTATHSRVEARGFGETLDDLLPLSVDDWKNRLGLAWFRLGRGANEPSMRQLFGYFARREATGGFLSPLKYFPQQPRGDVETWLMYLLGLDWRIAVEIQRIREEEAALARRGDAGELRALAARAEGRVEELRRAASAFQVLPEYSDLEAELAVVTDQLGSLADLNVVDRREVHQLAEALQTDVAPPMADVARMYEELGIVLPELVRRRFDEVREFHEVVVRNRSLYLEGERAAAEARMAGRRPEADHLTDRQQQLRRLLGEHGALEQLLALQRDLADAELNAARAREALNAVVEVERRRAELRVEKSQQLLRLQQDLAEQETILERVARSFERATGYLYEQPGTLEISADASGLVIRTAIQGDRSSGVRRMEIFCFDLALYEAAAYAGVAPGFLIHDSHLFDGVDVRQVGAALEYGRDLAVQLGFQYIVTLNSDDWPQLVERLGEDVVLTPRLTDASEDGGLFGFRFD